jgi:hypothetical protein
MLNIAMPLWGGSCGCTMYSTITLLLLLSQRLSYVCAPFCRGPGKQLVSFACRRVHCLICRELLRIVGSLSNIRSSFCRRNRNGTGVCRCLVSGFFVHSLLFLLVSLCITFTLYQRVTISAPPLPRTNSPLILRHAYQTFPFHLPAFPQVASCPGVNPNQSKPIRQ